MHTGGNGTHSADRAPSGDTMRITADCVFCASSGTAGTASIAGGSRRSWSSSGASAWVRRPRTWCLPSYATGTGAASGTLHADHQVPIRERPDLRLDLDNLRTRCDRCHLAKTKRECARGEGVGGLIFTIARAKRPWATLAQKFPGFELFHLWTTK